jgi:hypothetical protein
VKLPPKEVLQFQPSNTELVCKRERWLARAEKKN